MDYHNFVPVKTTSFWGGFSPLPIPQISSGSLDISSYPTTSCHAVIDTSCSPLKSFWGSIYSPLLDFFENLHPKHHQNAARPAFLAYGLSFGFGTFQPLQLVHLDCNVVNPTINDPQQRSGWWLTYPSEKYERQLE
jgi:hypothetical protein